MEIEAKIKLKDLRKLRTHLKSAGAVFDGCSFERNWLFDHPEQTLTKQDKLLRVRQERKVSLTFKGPRRASDYKKRDELELEFPDASTASSLLRAVGFEEWFYYEKIREVWRLDNSEIDVDELPELGLFVEVEGPSEQDIEAVRKKLKLPRDYINVSYVELLQESVKSPSKRTLQFRFPEHYQSALMITEATTT
jgi:adenylate cyclase class 2